MTKKKTIWIYVHLLRIRSDEDRGTCSNQSTWFLHLCLREAVALIHISTPPLRSVIYKWTFYIGLIHDHFWSKFHIENGMNLNESAWIQIPSQILTVRLHAYWCIAVIYHTYINIYHNTHVDRVRLKVFAKNSLREGYDVLDLSRVMSRLSRFYLSMSFFLSPHSYYGLHT